MEEDIPVRRLEDGTCVIYLEAPKSQVNLLQVFFELYDGLALVRTVRGVDGPLCLITTESQIEEAKIVLQGVRRDVRWRIVESDRNPLD